LNELGAVSWEPGSRVKVVPVDFLQKSIMMSA
jgi:hypothetical protein